MQDDSLKSWFALYGDEEDSVSTKRAGRHKVLKFMRNAYKPIPGQSRQMFVQNFIGELIKAGKDLPATEIYQLAYAKGISHSILIRAKKLLKIEHYKQGMLTFWKLKGEAKDGKRFKQR